MQDEVEVKALVERIALRFKSGNSIPIERAHITADEWSALSAAALRQRPVVDNDAYCDNVLDTLWRDYGEDSVQYQTALGTYRQMRHRPVVDDAAIDSLRCLAACAYQLAGYHDAPEIWLDRLSQAANGDPLPDSDTIASELLPYSPVVDDARMARALEWIRDYSRVDRLAKEHLPAIEEAISAYQQDSGGK